VQKRPLGLAKAADSLKLMTITSGYFWGSFLLPKRVFDVLDALPLGVALFWAMWVSAAPASLIAVPFAVRDLRRRRPWWQVVLAGGLAIALWVKMSRVHF
jgi:hypothetical protein